MYTYNRVCAPIINGTKMYTFGMYTKTYTYRKI